MSEPLVHRHHDTFELPEAPRSPGRLLPGRLAISRFPPTMKETLRVWQFRSSRSSRISSSPALRPAEVSYPGGR